MAPGGLSAGYLKTSVRYKGLLPLYGRLPLINARERYRANTEGKKQPFAPSGTTFYPE